MCEIEIKLYNDNFTNIIDKVQPNSVDLILIDIPYNISKDNNFHTMKDRKGRVGINFGNWDYNFDEKKLDILPKLLKNGGSLLCFSSFAQISKLEDVFHNLILKDYLIWKKSNPMPRNRDRRYVSDTEICSWYVKGGDKWVFNRQKETYESSVLEYPSESGGGFKRFHPTQKNLEMVEKLILIHSNKNDLVLDCFMGGGTTGVACINTHRNFIGVEISKNYFETAENRIMGKFKKRLF